MSLSTENEWDAWLERFAQEVGGELKKKGGYLLNDFAYDRYVVLKVDKDHSVSIAIRRPTVDVEPYFAIVRKAVAGGRGRKKIEDRLPLLNQRQAVTYFKACVEIAQLTSSATTIALLDERSEFGVR